MKDILLVTTSEKMKVVFETLERRGDVHVRTATSLSLAQFAIGLATPDCTFVEISSDCMDIQIEQISQILPEDADLAVLAEDPVSITWQRQRSVPVIDMSLGEEALRAAISGVVDRLADSVLHPAEPEPVPAQETCIDLAPELWTDGAAVQSAEPSRGYVPAAGYPTVAELLEREAARGTLEPQGRRDWRMPLFLGAALLFLALVMVLVFPASGR